MSWSLASVSYRMSGSGSWQLLLPDESARRLYSKIYPAGVRLGHLNDQHQRLLNTWQQAAMVKFEDQKAVPLGPIMTDDDLKVLDSWFHNICNSMCEAVLERLTDFHSLASNLAGGNSVARQVFENVLTIQICAQTLDSWVFSMLRQELIGTYSPRDFAGNFFFWGYAFATGPERIFGFTTYGGWTGERLHIMRSHGLDRERLKTALRRRDTFDYIWSLLPGGLVRDRAVSSSALTAEMTQETVSHLRDVKIVAPDDPPRLAIPVFSEKHMKPAAELYGTVAEKIMKTFSASVDELKVLIDRCTFARCSWPDILCMLFHLAYSYAADRLVERGTIRDFPQSAGGGSN
ncbi:MAG: hypothetical protein JRI85_09420 [Deltaproteobacteria bacterium]|nr:hypothetical protein [Deltaproteobacteria bacterium]